MKRISDSLSPFIAESPATPFLNESVDALLQAYPNEPRIHDRSPYTEIAHWWEIPPSEMSDLLTQFRIQVDETPFKLASDTEEWRYMQSTGFAAIRESGRVRFDSPVIKLLDFSVYNATFSVQYARYFDQAMSNLILDWNGLEGTAASIREMLGIGGRLPPINEPHLANTVGICVMVLHEQDSVLKPYFVYRTDDNAVFRAGAHETASGAAEWPQPTEPSTFERFFLKDMYRELYEEVGLREEDMSLLVPVALAREFYRAGKPTIFFVGATHLSREKSDRVRERTVDIIEGTGGKSEVRRESCLISGEDLAASVGPHRVTTEAFASMVYTEAYVDIHGPAILEQILQDRASATDKPQLLG